MADSTTALVAVIESLAAEAALKAAAVVEGVTARDVLGNMGMIPAADRSSRFLFHFFVDELLGDVYSAGMAI
jgi:hypothetical protein